MRGRNNTTFSAAAFLGLLFLVVIALTGCGGGGGGSSSSGGNSNPASNSNMLSGTVAAPGGTLAAVSSTGMTPVANATVTLLKINNAGSPLNVQPAGLPVATTTDATGKYYLTLPSGVVPAPDVVVIVGSGSTTMRSIVSNPSIVNINPATEAATQLIANGVNSIAYFTAAEVEAIKSDILKATATVMGSSISAAISATVAAANIDSAVTAAITVAATPGQGGAPVISSFNPASALPGEQVTITGLNFSTIQTDNTVNFNGVQATVISATATQMVVTVPGALTGAITVTVGGSTATSASNFTVMSGVPSIPALVTASAGDGQITIGWQAASGATSYNVYYSTNAGVTKTSGTKISQASSPYIIKSLTNGTIYYAVVTAVNTYGESVESTEVNAKPVLYIGNPDTVLHNITTLNVGTKAVGLQWDNMLYGGSLPGMLNASVCYGPSPLIDITNGCIYAGSAGYVNRIDTYNGKPLDPYTTYYFTVVAYDPLANRINFPTVSATPAYDLPAPQNLTATPGPLKTDVLGITTASIDLKWDPVFKANPSSLPPGVSPYVSFYTVGWNTTHVDTTPIKWGPSNGGTGVTFTGASSANIYDLKCNTTYYVAVAACDRGTDYGSIWGITSNTICDTSQTPTEVSVTTAACNTNGGTTTSTSTSPYKGTLDITNNSCSYTDVYGTSSMTLFNFSIMIDANGNIQDPVNGNFFLGSISDSGGLSISAGVSPGVPVGAEGTGAWTGQLIKSGTSLSGSGTYVGYFQYINSTQIGPCNGTWTATGTVQ